jgi:outer membrane protein assembly factor BamB
MKMQFIFLGIAFFISTTLFSQTNLSEYQKNWPQWRGPNMDGISPDGNPPLEWSETKNIKWKVEIPGKGHSTPIIWGDYIFLATAIPTDKKVEVAVETESQQGSRRRGPRGVKTDNIHEFTVISVNRQNGKILWKKILREEHPQDGTHQFGSWASHSPVTDGKTLYAYFGSRGLYCLDLDGNVKWERDFGKMEKIMSFGEGSSPLLYKNKLYLLRDHEGQSALYALDKNNGKDIWIKERDEGSSWATPFVVEVNGKVQIITTATKEIRSYDPETGEIIWTATGLTRNVIPMPVVKENIIYLMSGFRGNALLAIDLKNAKGDVTNTAAVIWRYDQDTPYAPSPILIDNLLYFLRVNNGDLSCLDARDGKVYYSKENLEGLGDLFTSPVSAMDRIYILGRKGLTQVVKHGTQFEVLAKNQLDDEFIASPAIIGNTIYIRGYQHLYCISE